MNADVHALAGAYALDALPEQERETFRRHMARCPSCQQEVRELQSTAARLGAVADEPPPAPLKARVMELAARTRQLPPHPVEDASQVVTPFRRRRVPLLAAAAALVAIALAGGFALGSWLDDDQAQDQIAAVLGSDDARTDQVDLTGGGTLTLISSAEQDKVVVTAQDLPEPGENEVYQLWIVDDAGVRSAEEFFYGSGQGQVRLLDDIDETQQVAITREPEGGSDQPTMDPLGIAPVAAA
jgi:anti-sigma-K factor RskA